MGISKIGSLFAANVDSVASRPQNSNTSEQSSTQQAAASQRDGEAVVLSASLGRSQTPVESSEDRAARVQALKSQVTSGRYKVDSEKTAVAVLRDLA